MRLHKNDIIVFTAEPDPVPMRVVKMRAGQITLAPHTAGGDLKRRDGDANDGFKYRSASAKSLMAGVARKLQVLPDGTRRWGSAAP